MSDRIIFTIKHEKKVLAYIYQNWGAKDGPELEKEVLKAAKDNRLDLTRQADAIKAAYLAGVAFYGHAKWTGAERYDEDQKWTEATECDREYLAEHPDEIAVDNENDKGFTFFYGTGNGYPEYIDGWCEAAYNMEV